MKPFDLSWLSPSLAMGGRLPTDAGARLRGEHGITRVIDLRAEEQDDIALLRAQGVDVLLLPVPDVHAVPSQMLDEGVAWSLTAQERGEKVLIHCEHGIGRSALLALCVLVADGRTPCEALSHAKKLRACVSPSPAQLQALMAWASEWCRRTGRCHVPPTFEELAIIAYSHLRSASSAEVGNAPAPAPNAELRSD